MAIKRCADVSISTTRPRKMMRVVVKSWSRFLPLYIPDDVIFNILSRLPSKSAVRFKSVCKAWHAMMSNPCFIKAHLECSKERPSVLLGPGAYEKQKNGEKSSFLMDFYKYQGGSLVELVHSENFPCGIAAWARPVHCNGLLLICTVNHEMIIINPATKEIAALPKGSDNLHKGPRVGFGFDPHSNKYKAARFFYQIDDETLELVCKFEVLTLGTNAWRPTDDPPYPIQGFTPVHVKGSIYWITGSTPLFPEPPNAFLRFCLTEEKFSLLPYPPCDVKPGRLIELEDELCCASFSRQTLAPEIWTCSAGQNPKWTRRCTVLIPPDVVKHPIAEPPTVSFHGKILILAWNQKVYRYDIQTCKLEKIASAVTDLSYYDPRNNKYQIYLEKEVELHIFNYAESLVRISEL